MKKKKLIEAETVTIEFIKACLNLNTAMIRVATVMAKLFTNMFYGIIEAITGEKYQYWEADEYDAKDMTLGE